MALDDFTSDNEEADDVVGEWSPPLDRNAPPENEERWSEHEPEVPEWPDELVDAEGQNKLKELNGDRLLAIGMKDDDANEKYVKSTSYIELEERL